MRGYRFMPTVFLGGTASTPWRVEWFIPEWVKAGLPVEALFNPVKKDWSFETDYPLEVAAKNNATHLVYYLTDPLQKGNPFSGYSSYEGVFGLIRDPQKTYIVLDHGGMLNDMGAYRMTQYRQFLQDKFSQYSRQIFSDPELALAKLVFDVKTLMGQPVRIYLDGTCGDNLWRGLFVRLAQMQGLPKDIFIDTVSDSYHKTMSVEEDYLRETVPLVVIYLGSSSKKESRLSDASHWNAQYLLATRPGQVVVICDKDGLEGHVLKRMKSFTADLRAMYPGRPIFDDTNGGMDAAVRWLKDRLTLSS